MSLQFLEFSKPNSKCIRERKKKNCYVNSVIFLFCLFVALFMFGLSFLFLLVHSEFGSETSRDYKDISYKHPQFCSTFFCYLHFEILIMVS
jgi:hypothetical protein